MANDRFVYVTYIKTTPEKLWEALTTPFFDSPLSRRAEALPNLGAYVDRMMARFYPTFPWCELSQAA